MPGRAKGTRRVQLVRRDGRDVSTLYGREGGGGAHVEGDVREVSPVARAAVAPGPRREVGARRRAAAAPREAAAAQDQLRNPAVERELPPEEEEEE